MLKWVCAAVFVSTVLFGARASGQVLTSAGDAAGDAFGGVTVVEDAHAPAEPVEPQRIPPSPVASSSSTSSSSSAARSSLSFVPASGPARPVHPAWAEAVERFTRSVEAGDAAAVANTVADGASVTPFGAARTIAPSRLVEQVAGHVLLGFHAYHHPPVALAADVANDVSSAPIVPDELKRNLVPSDETELARSNDIAAHWVNQTLSPERHQAVGVVVWWDVVAAKPSFMLIKGEAVGAKQYNIVQVVFGNPLVRDGE